MVPATCFFSIWRRLNSISLCCQVGTDVVLGGEGGGMDLTFNSSTRALPAWSLLSEYCVFPFASTHLYISAWLAGDICKSIKEAPSHASLFLFLLTMIYFVVDQEIKGGAEMK
jgi:hypothetical protein